MMNRISQDSPDPRTQREYALIPEVRYNRFKAFFEYDLPSLEEQKWALQQAGIRAGWYDPIWDEKDELPGREAS